jgi:hypothetical protein
MQAISIMSYAIAAVLHVTVELPFANVTKVLIPARKASKMRRGGSEKDELHWRSFFSSDNRRLVPLSFST